jgi:hypothetical protein
MLVVSKRFCFQVIDFIGFYFVKKLARRLQYTSYEFHKRIIRMRERYSMTRQSLTQLRVSPLRLQQGLFASLALMVTLIGGQQLAHWQSQQQVAAHFERPMMTQTHFRSVGSTAANVTTPQLTAVEQDSTLGDLPYQERWVF